MAVEAEKSAFPVHIPECKLDYSTVIYVFVTMRRRENDSYSILTHKEKSPKGISKLRLKVTVYFQG